MATVSSTLTRIHDCEGSLSSVSFGGGAGATANTDIFIQAAQSLGRRQSNLTLGGFMINDGATNDLSATDVHLGIWLWVTHYSVLTALRVRCAGAASGDYDEHIVPLTEYPALGGWIRVWLDISRTPDATGGSALNEAALQHVGPVVSLPAVGGNAQNIVMDAVDHAVGAGLTLAGTSGLWSDFVTADANTTNQYGIMRLVGGVLNCLGRVQLGTASSLVFTDANFTIIFPQQNLVHDAWMGISIDLQHASTAVTWASGVIQSSSVKKGDLVVTGTSGTFTATGMVCGNLRIVTLNSKCSYTQGAFGSCGQITAPGATLTNTQVTGYEGTANTSALIWNVATDPDGKMNGMTFIKGTAATHAIEFGLNSPTSMTLRNITFTSYHASNGNNDSTLHIKRTSGTVTITITGGTTPSYRTDGATVVIVAGAVTVLVNAKTVGGANIQNARVFLKAATGGPFPFDVTVTIANSGTTATVTHTSHGLLTNDKVVIKGASHLANNGVFTITVTGTNTYTYTMGSSPGSNPTGTIKATFVALEGLTDASGNISTSRVYASAQPVTGWVRKSTGSPLYKQALLGGSVSNTAGYTANAQLVSDE